jgi:hypothetical protein
MTYVHRPDKAPDRKAPASSEHPRSVPIIAPDAHVDQPFVEGAQDDTDPDLRHRLISEAAYRLYAERGYADGYDLDDWLQAEAAVDHLLVDKSSSPDAS